MQQQQESHQEAISALDIQIAAARQQMSDLWSYIQTLESERRHLIREQQFLQLRQQVGSISIQPIFDTEQDEQLETLFVVRLAAAEEKIQHHAYHKALEEQLADVFGTVKTPMPFDRLDQMFLQHPLFAHRHGIVTDVDATTQSSIPDTEEIKKIPPSHWYEDELVRAAMNRRGSRSRRDFATSPDRSIASLSLEAPGVPTVKKQRLMQKSKGQAKPSVAGRADFESQIQDNLARGMQQQNKQPPRPRNPTPSTAAAKSTLMLPDDSMLLQRLNEIYDAVAHAHEEFDKHNGQLSQATIDQLKTLLLELDSLPSYNPIDKPGIFTRRRECVLAILLMLKQQPTERDKTGQKPIDVYAARAVRESPPKDEPKGTAELKETIDTTVTPTKTLEATKSALPKRSSVSMEDAYDSDISDLSEIIRPHLATPHVVTSTDEETLRDELRKRLSKMTREYS